MKAPTPTICLHCKEPLEEGVCKSESHRTRIITKRCLMSGLDQSDPEDIIQLQMFRRQKIIEGAVNAADRLIMEGSDGTVEETNYFTAMVAEILMQKAIQPFRAAVVKKDVADSAERAGFPQYRDAIMAAPTLTSAIQEADRNLSDKPHE